MDGQILREIESRIAPRQEANNEHNNGNQEKNILEILLAG
jgi:hypothetical protein